MTVDELGTAAADKPIETVGFVGLGVMGAPMSCHLVAKRGRTGLTRLLGHDIRNEPLARLADQGVENAGSLQALARASDLVFLSLPSGVELAAVCRGAEGLLACGHTGLIVVDLGTSPVALSQALHDDFAAQGMRYLDAPVTRTRTAAVSGTLSCMVGGDADLLERVRPFLDCFSEVVTHCGGKGTGQVVKQMNNMVAFQTVVALAEALGTARRAGVDDRLLFETLGKGSAESFVLRNHGMKSLLPDDHPLDAFPTRYALKDLSYALALARDNGLVLSGGENTRRLLEETIEAGFGDNYFTALYNVVNRDSDDAS